MLIFILILFALTATGGLFLLSYVLREKETPKGVALIHGGVAAISILLLVIYCLLYEGPWASLLVFILAAVGGFFLLGLDIFSKKIPKSLAIGHGCIALLGFVLLVLFIF